VVDTSLCWGGGGGHQCRTMRFKLRGSSESCRISRTDTDSVTGPLWASFIDMFSFVVPESLSLQLEVPSRSELEYFSGRYGYFYLAQLKARGLPGSASGVNSEGVTHVDHV
jgi:hypothetical protein